MKTIITLVLTLSLMSSIALAEGNQGNGGRGTLQTTTSKTQTLLDRAVLVVLNQYFGVSF